MVSKAREGFPQPDSPVKTISRSRGRSRETSWRLCSRAPRTTKRSAIRAGYRWGVSPRSDRRVDAGRTGAVASAGHAHHWFVQDDGASRAVELGVAVAE